MLFLINLRNILHCNFVYYILLFIILILYIISSNNNVKSVYVNFSNKTFIISNIVRKDYGFKLDLRGKEKVLGFIYCDDDCTLYEGFNIGDKVLINGEISDVSHDTVPNTFDYKDYLVSNKIYNVIEISNMKLISSNKNIFYKIKKSLINRSKKLDKSYPYISSLIFGNNSYLDDDVISSYRDNGISHLFAISGLHISVFICLIGFILDKFKINLIIKYLVIISFLIFYMFLTNFAMSVVRGSVFVILIIVNKIFKLEISTRNLLILALVLILFSNPLLFNNIGLKYSFLVTLFLIMFSDLLKGNRIYQLFMISLIAFLVSYPITINNFNQVNFLSIFYNIFFVPFVSFILLPGVLLGYLFPGLDNVLYFFIKIIETISQFLVYIDFGKISMCKLGLLIIVSYYVTLYILLSGFKKNKIKLFFIFCLFLIAHYFAPFTKENYIIFFDVNQGDSAFINVNSNYTLIDTGGIVMYNDKQYTYKLSKNRLLPYFKSMGIRKLNNLVLTHGDADHIKEAYYLIDNFIVDKVYMNLNSMNNEELRVYNLCKKKKIKIIFLKKNSSIDIGGYYLKSLNYNRVDENDSSIVLYGNINNYKVLFTGDISNSIELDILNEYKINNLYILKLAHHGSNTSNDYNFLENTSPKYGVISSGKNNRFGHPSYETIDSLEQLNISYFNTAYNGSIKFSLDNGTYSYYPP